MVFINSCTSTVLGGQWKNQPAWCISVSIELPVKVSEWEWFQYRRCFQWKGESVFCKNCMWHRWYGSFKNMLLHALSSCIKRTVYVSTRICSHAIMPSCSCRDCMGPVSLSPCSLCNSWGRGGEKQTSTLAWRQLFHNSELVSFWRCRREVGQCSAPCLHLTATTLPPSPYDLV